LEEARLSWLYSLARAVENTDSADSSLSSRLDLMMMMMVVMMMVMMMMIPNLTYAIHDDSVIVMHCVSYQIHGDSRWFLSWFLSSKCQWLDPAAAPRPLRPIPNLEVLGQDGNGGEMVVISNINGYINGYFNIANINGYLIE
jgi:hypothetical protein